MEPGAKINKAYKAYTPDIISKIHILNQPDTKLFIHCYAPDGCCIITDLPFQCNFYCCIISIFFLWKEDGLPTVLGLSIF